MRAALGIFCTAAAYQLYRFLGQPNGVPAIAALAAHYLLSAVISLWVVADARERPHWKLYDFGSFVFFLWPVIALIYLFQNARFTRFRHDRLVLCYLSCGDGVRDFHGLSSISTALSDKASHPL